LTPFDGIQAEIHGTWKSKGFFIVTMNKENKQVRSLINQYQDGGDRKFYTNTDPQKNPILAIILIKMAI
jgi:hypothetical protein